jgi:type IX secretion system PorP/SprF family membrane protein
MKYFKFNISIFLLTFFSFNLKAQDPQFTQYFAAPIYLNPAFTGDGDKWRVGTSYRSQWNALDNHFVSNSVYADVYDGSISSGFGIIVNHHKEGLLNLSSTDIGLSYAYDLKISDDNSRSNNDTHFKMGAQFSSYRKSLDFNKLVFGSQIDIDNGIINAFSGESLNREQSDLFLSISAGVLLYKEKWWLGASLHHINEPNQSFLTGSENLLRQKMSVHGGFRASLGKGPRSKRLSGNLVRDLNFNFNYRAQGGFSQLDFGLQAFLEPFIVGLSYRGIPIKKVEEIFNNESIALMTGLKLNGGITFGYSYDVTLSNLSGSTNGSHEISFSLAWGRQKKSFQRLRCPKGQL